MIRFKLFSGIFLFAVIILTGCAKEGCTDESAENYNITADEDDGSCIYCTGSNEEFIGLGTSTVVDSRFSSPFHNETVLSINIATKQIVYPLITCGQSGCFLVVTATNVTDAVITNLHFNMPVSFQGFGTSNFNFGPLPVLNPGESHTFDTINLQLMFADCPPLSPNQFSGNINSASYD